jgi:hypothetical protein
LAARIDAPGGNAVTHEDAGKYGAKHPAGTVPDDSIAAALKGRADGGRVTCAVAHSIAQTLGVAPLEVGKTIDLLEYRIIECQLGLFGYAPVRKIVEPAPTVSDDLRGQLERFAREGEIGCASAWQVADGMGLPRMAVSAACESLGIKIKRCQLGAF